MGLIRIDGRVGSVHYIPLINALQDRRLAVRATLPFGDVCFKGNGPDGIVQVGVEVKKLRDLINCMISHRLTAHQLPGMAQSFDHSWLVIEGIWRFDYETGVLMVPAKHTWFRSGGKKSSMEWEPLELGNRRFGVKDVGSFITSLEVEGGVRLHYTSNERDTALYLWNLHRWWSKPWHAHKTRLSIQSPALLHCALRKPSIVVQMAAAIPGVGPKKAHAAAEEFETVLEMVKAPVKRWAQVAGVGETIARRVHKILRGRKP